MFTFNTFEEFFPYFLSFNEKEIEEVTAIRNAQFETCQGFTRDIEAVTREIERTEGFISWINTRLQANEAKIEEIFDGRCKTHMNYLNFMKNSQITLRLLAFLRTALENYSLIQLKHIGEILTKYKSSSLNNEEILKVMLIELKGIQDGPDFSVKGRTADEIGTGHIDEGRDNIELGSMTYLDRQGLEGFKT